ncbi:MAG: serine--tRNA ligase [Candidatus Pacebacteria bacterium]|nr:serine--tRNA ligase [Candidatus Paceibacterota bacterium]
MIDIKFLLKNPEKVKTSLKNRGVDLDVDKLISLEEERKKLLQEVENLRKEQNDISPKVKDNPELLSKAKELKASLKEKEEVLDKTEQEFKKNLSLLPNIPLDDVPVGKDETESKVVREWGKAPKFNFQIKDHAELGKEWDLIDIERAAKVSGARFTYLKNELALIEFALIQLAFDTLLKEGFVPVIPPIIIRDEMMKSMGYVDTEADFAERYYLEKDKLFLVGTAEQSIGPMHQGEILEDLPKRYVAFSTCLREESGSYGKDTKGIFRLHQFDKLEMFSFTKPEDSEKEHLFLLSLEEKMMQALKLPYRVVHLCTGDMSRPSASTYDIETWFPSQNRYRETHSVSNCTDFQSRRLNIRFKSGEGKTEFVHMLNGTAFAMVRMLIAIIENYQRKDGRIDVPKVLQKYLGFKIIPKK